MPMKNLVRLARSISELWLLLYTVYKNTGYNTLLQKVNSKLSLLQKVKLSLLPACHKFPVPCSPYQG